MNPLWQNALVALIVAYCAFGALRQLMPRALQQTLSAWGWQRRARLSFWLEQRASLHWRRLGVWLRPRIELQTSCGSGAGCNKCGSCAS